jgi:dTDP-glucose 4,6-dehydratase
VSASVPHTLLVTGGAGFIGQNLVHFVAAGASDRRIVVLDALTYAANPTSLEPLARAGRIKLIHADIADVQAVEEVFRTEEIDAVAHLAAESHVDRSISGPDVFLSTNVVGTHTLLKCALADWQRRGCMDAARFLHVSTDEVFGDLEADEPAFTEASPYRPSSPYSATKAASDHLARAYQRTYGLPVIVTNCSNNYGPYQHPEKLIPLMAINALEGKPLPVYGDGTNVRDWLFVEDHCRALALALERGTTGQTYAIGGGAEKKNIEIVNFICAHLDARFAQDSNLRKRYPRCPAASGQACRSLISYVKDRPGHDRRYAINSGFASRALGYRPQETFESGLARTVDWYLANEAWWRRALSADFSRWMERTYGAPRDLMA